MSFAPQPKTGFAALEDRLTTRGARLARDPFKIGVVALVVGALIAALVVVTSLVSFGTKSYTAVLAQTAGLRVGESVEVHGVPVGEVTSIKLDAYYQEMVKGAIIVGAVVLDQWRQRKGARG